MRCRPANPDYPHDANLTYGSKTRCGEHRIVPGFNNPIHNDTATGQCTNDVTRSYS